MPINLILSLVSLLPDLISAAEAVMGAKTGPQKKEAVINAFGKAMNIATDLSKGGQKHTMEKIAPVVGPLVDFVAGQLFPSGNIEDTQPSA